MIRIARIDATRLDLNTYNGNIYNEVGDKANMATTFDPDQLQRKQLSASQGVVSFQSPLAELKAESKLF